jgi:hypothetical protein
MISSIQVHFSSSEDLRNPSQGPTMGIHEFFSEWEWNWIECEIRGKFMKIHDSLSLFIIYECYGLN